MRASSSQKTVDSSVHCAGITRKKFNLSRRPLRPEEETFTSLQTSSGQPKGIDYLVKYLQTHASILTSYVLIVRFYEGRHSQIIWQTRAKAEVNSIAGQVGLHNKERAYTLFEHAMRSRKFRWSDTSKQVAGVCVGLAMFETGHPEVFWAISVRQASYISLCADCLTISLANPLHIPPQDSPNTQSGRKNT